MLLQDIRYALRNLARSKGFATVAILCLGFGVGLNATIFSLIDGVLLKPYPYTDPDRLLVVGEQSRRPNDEAGLSYLDMRDWKEANSTFSTIAGGQRTQPDGRGRQRRAGTLSWRRRVVGSVSDARHAPDSRARLHARRRSRRRAGRRASRLRHLDAPLWRQRRHRRPARSWSTASRTWLSV